MISAIRQTNERPRDTRNRRLPISKPSPQSLAVAGSVFAIIFTILIAGGAIEGGQGKVNSLKAVNVASVSTMPAWETPGYETVHEFVGRVEARRESKLSLELGGLVADVLADEGDWVTEGQIIAILDTQLLSSRRNATVAKLESAQAQLDEMVAGPRIEVIDAARADVSHWQAQRQLSTVTKSRQQRLMAQNAGSQQDLDDAAYRDQSVSGQLQAAQARLLELENGTRTQQVASQRAIVQGNHSELETIDIRIAKSHLRAPYSGTVSERFVDEGTVIDAGTPVLELLETGRLEVRIGASTDALAELKPGSDQIVFVGGQPIAAIVRAVRPDRNQQTRTVSVLLEIRHNDTAVHVGDLATLSVKQQIDQSGFWLPIAALVESHRGLWSSYVAVASDADQDSAETRYVLQPRELEVVHQTSDSAFVRGSLSQGDLVVVTGIQRLVPHQQVTLLERVSTTMTLARNQ